MRQGNDAGTQVAGVIATSWHGHGGDRIWSGRVAKIARGSSGTELDEQQQCHRQWQAERALRAGHQGKRSRQRR
jgi:hypothetical protein